MSDLFRYHHAVHGEWRSFPSYEPTPVDDITLYQKLNNINAEEFKRGLSDKPLYTVLSLEGTSANMLFTQRWKWSARRHLGSPPVAARYWSSVLSHLDSLPGRPLRIEILQLGLDRSSTEVLSFPHIKCCFGQKNIWRLSIVMTLQVLFSEFGRIFTERAGVYWGHFSVEILAYAVWAIENNRVREAHFQNPEFIRHSKLLLALGRVNDWKISRHGHSDTRDEHNPTPKPTFLHTRSSMLPVGGIDKSCDIPRCRATIPQSHWVRGQEHTGAVRCGNRQDSAEAALNTVHPSSSVWSSSLQWQIEYAGGFIQRQNWNGRPQPQPVSLKIGRAHV